MFQTARHFVTGVGSAIAEKNLTLIAAGVAFYGMLALFPGLAAVIAIWGLLSDPHILLEQLQLVDSILPAEVTRLVESQLNALMNTSGDKLGWAGIISTMVAIWSARSGVAALMLGLNAIHGRDNRSSLRHYLTALALTMALLGVSVVTLSAVVIVPIVLAIVPLGPMTSLLIEGFRWAAAIFVLLAGLAVVYRFGPNNRGERMKWVTPGAGMAVILWAVASYGFSFYLSNFANYNEVYGSIGAAIAMLMWLFISAFLILLGAVVNLQLSSRHSLNRALTQG
ncbi:YihY/virulence factor BrkB family protein [Pseudooceanicola atlanticus]|uniref:YihY/virulence factor BrkB family protein n=1 Tax=Pseudooceanicola atlanticus TaxID=1461694 RepID=UPI0006941AA7|nr:YihY/virulence factor BrkB family protein [Pseudooceanicola atlanticus]